MNEKINAKKAEGNTPKKQNVYVSKYAKGTNRSSLTDKQVISINESKADKVYSSLPNQVKNLLHHIDTIRHANGSCTMQDLNKVWFDEYVATDVYKQDASVVLSHYLAVFSKGYKRLTSDDLNIFNIS
tara:strand:- start:420 stop:803 length:384 start_codon:yes stop_codon:yes gene_type:complete